MAGEAFSSQRHAVAWPPPRAALRSRWRPVTGGSPAAVSCDKAAAPSGSDSRRRDVREPVSDGAEAGGLAAPGQTGCLRPASTSRT